MKTMRGFTLIELLVVIAIIGILVGVAIPNFRAMAANNRQVSAANELVSGFITARNQAVTLSREVKITALNNDWKKGWQVTSLDSDPANTTDLDPSGNVLNYVQKTLLIHEPLASELIVTADTTGNPAPLAFQFDRQGHLAIADGTYHGAPMPGKMTITICDDRTGEMGHQITLEPIGSVSSSTVTCP